MNDRLVHDIDRLLEQVRRSLDSPADPYTAKASIATELSLEIERIRIGNSLATRRRIPSREDLRNCASEIVDLLVAEDFNKVASEVEFTRAIIRPRDDNEHRPLLKFMGSSNKTVRQALLVVAAHISDLLDTQPDLLEALPENALRRLIPDQKIAPAQFDIVNSRLVLLQRASSVARDDRHSVAVAKEELLTRGAEILSELERSNCDRRFVEVIKDLHQQLQADQNIVKLGLGCLRSSIMCESFKVELPTAVSAMLTAYHRSLELYAGQFPEWTRFLENAAKAQFTDSDVSAIHDATEKLADRLAAEPTIVAPEVPATLRQLNSLLTAPGATAKRAAFALIRTVENLISKAYAYGAEFMDKTVQTSIDHGSKVAGRAIVITLLTVALQASGVLGPVAGKLNELSWLKNATELVEQQIKRMKSE